jgi:hypothetical protein
LQHLSVLFLLAFERFIIVIDPKGSIKTRKEEKSIEDLTVFSVSTRRQRVREEKKNDIALFWLLSKRTFAKKKPRKILYIHKAYWKL